MVVLRYFYVDIVRIARQARDIENDGTHSQISTTIYNHRMEGQFHFLTF
jgi:hypothetical protein